MSKSVCGGVSILQNARSQESYMSLIHHARGLRVPGPCFQDRGCKGCVLSQLWAPVAMIIWAGDFIDVLYIEYKRPDLPKEHPQDKHYLLDKKVERTCPLTMQKAMEVVSLC